MELKDSSNSGLGSNPAELDEFLDEEASGELSLDDLAELSGGAGAIHSNHSKPSPEVGRY